MPYCSKCGAKIIEDAYFCPNCGTKTQKGADAKVKYPSDEMREAFTKAGMELEKAFTIAAREMHNAFQKSRENMDQKPKTEQKATVTCQSCSAINEADAVFCRNCGNKIASA
jgi:uncharacterized membrane protein YvbJ